MTSWCLYSGWLVRFVFKISCSIMQQLCFRCNMETSSNLLKYFLLHIKSLLVLALRVLTHKKYVFSWILVGPQVLYRHHHVKKTSADLHTSSSRYSPKSNAHSLIFFDKIVVKSSNVWYRLFLTIIDLKLHWKMIELQYNRMNHDRDQLMQLI